MTKYSVDIWTEEGGWETVGLFSHKASKQGMMSFAKEQLCHTSKAEDVAIVDMDTGEVLWNWTIVDESDADIYDDADETFYDPYLGCDVFD